MRPSELPVAGAGGTDTGATHLEQPRDGGNHHHTRDNGTPSSTSSSSYANFDSTQLLAPTRVLSPRRYTVRSITPSPLLYPSASPRSFATDSALDATEFLPHASVSKVKAARASASSTRTNVTLFSRRHIGLLVSLAFASVFTSCVKRGLLPLLKSELKMSQTQLDAAQVLVILPWASSFFLGFCSDAIPIFGCHRKSYMVLGWLVASASLFALSIVNYAQEYDTRLKNGDATLNAEDRIQVLDLYVALLALASFGGILSVVVAEIYVIQQSRREPLRYRGHIVATFLITQFSCEMVGQMVTDLVIFRVTKLGSFPLLTFRNLLFFFVVYALVPIPVLICFFDERVGDSDERQAELESGERKARKGMHDAEDGDDDNTEDGVDLGASVVPVLGGADYSDNDDDDDDGSRGTEQHAKAVPKRCCTCNLFTSLKLHAKSLWRTLRRDSTWRIVRFLGFFIFFTEFTLEYPMQMIERWCGMTLKFESSGKILSEAMYAIAVFVWKLLCMDTDWRVLMGGTLVGVYLLPQAVYFYLAIYGVGRSGETYVMFSMLRGFIRGMIVVIQVALAVEITPRGSEGSTLGVIVSIGTVMRLMANTHSIILGNWLTSDGSKSGDISGASASSSTADDDGDTRAIRNHVASALGVCFFMRLIALFGLKFLPKQKRALQALLRAETPSLGSAISVLATLLGSLAFVAVVNVWIVTPKSACARNGGCNVAADTVVG